MAIIAKIRPEQIKSITSGLIAAAEAKSIVEKVADDVDIGPHKLQAEQFESDIASGSGAPFIVASDTVVTNLHAANSDALGGATFAAPGAIGGTTPGGGAFAALSTTGQLTLGTEGSSAGHCVSKAYVDARAAGLDPKASVASATTGDLDLHAGITWTYDNIGNDDTSGAGATLTASGDSVITIDGFTLNNGERFLVKDQTEQTHNGLYTVTTVGAADSTCILTRADDNDEDALMSTGSFVFVGRGTLNANSGWVLSYNDGVDVDWGDDLSDAGTDFVWTQFSGAGLITAGDGLAKVGNIINLDEVLEAPSGLVNSSNTVYNLSVSAYSDSAVDLYLNGLLQHQAAGNAGDYAMSVSSSRITFQTAPATDDTLTCRFRK
jgi:hypothetical protein